MRPQGTVRSGSCPDNRGSGAPGGRPCTEAARPLPALCGERRHACDPAAVCPARQPSSSQVKEDNSTGARREPEQTTAPGPEKTRTDNAPGARRGTEPTTAPGPGGNQNRRQRRGWERIRTDDAPGARRGTELTTRRGPGGGRNPQRAGGPEGDGTAQEWVGSCLLPFDP